MSPRRRRRDGEGPPLPLVLARPRGRPLRILCLGAHADDIEIGCGGTVLSLLAARSVDCHWVVFAGGGSPREREARRSARRFLARARRSRVDVHRFRDGFFPFIGGEIKDAFEALGRLVAPDVVFTHTREDRHQDHRVVSDLTWNTFRSHVILEYEVPKYDGDLGQPNLFVPLSDATARAKIRHLMAVFESQRRKSWFTAETFRGVMRLRGIESRASAGWAEAFHARKLSLAP